MKKGRPPFYIDMNIYTTQETLHDIENILRTESKEFTTLRKIYIVPAFVHNDDDEIQIGWNVYTKHKRN